jgi:hypothetical protein
MGRKKHFAEAHNEDEERHVAVAPAIGSAFFALECSIVRRGR